MFLRYMINKTKIFGLRAKGNAYKSLGIFEELRTHNLNYNNYEFFNAEGGYSFIKVANNKKIYKLSKVFVLIV